MDLGKNLLSYQVKLKLYTYTIEQEAFTNCLIFCNSIIFTDIDEIDFKELAHYWL